MKIMRSKELRLELGRIFKGKKLKGLGHLEINAFIVHER